MFPVLVSGYFRLDSSLSLKIYISVFMWFLSLLFPLLWLLLFGFDFSEGIISDLHLWFKLVIVSSPWFQAASEVDWSATLIVFNNILIL